MSTPETRGVRYRTSSRTPTVADYKTLLETPAGRLRAPTKATITVQIENEPGLARLELAVELLERRYAVVRLEAAPPAGAALDLEAVRRLRIPHFVRAGLAHLVVLESLDGETYTSERPIEDPDPLWPVALTYSVAQAFGEPPTDAVAEALRISHGAAAQRVKRARDAGYLPPTTKGRPS